jgi:hypothetical protein
VLAVPCSRGRHRAPAHAAQSRLCAGAGTERLLGGLLCIARLRRACEPDQAHLPFWRATISASDRAPGLLQSHGATNWVLMGQVIACFLPRTGMGRYSPPSARRPSSRRSRTFPSGIGVAKRSSSPAGPIGPDGTVIAPCSPSAPVTSWHHSRVRPCVFSGSNLRGRMHSSGALP